MNIVQKVEDFFLNQFAGKLIARAAVTIAAYVAGPVVQGIAAKAGISVSVDPQQLQAGMVLAAHAAFEAFKAWRAKHSAAAAPAPAQ